MGGNAGAAAAEGTRSLDQTPTWAVAAVCAVIVAASILLEGLLHHLGKVPRLSPLPSPEGHFEFCLRLLGSILGLFRLPCVLSVLLCGVLTPIADSFLGCCCFLLPVAHQAEEDGAVRGSGEGKIR